MPENKTIGELSSIDTWDRDADVIELEDASPNSGKKSTPQKLMDDVPATAAQAGSLSSFEFSKLIALAKLRVRVVASSNVTIATPGASIDSVSLSNGDRVLLTAQSAGAENGPWQWNGAATPLTRVSDAENDDQFAPGMLVYAQEGTVWAESFWCLTTTAAITVGTTSQTWKLFASSKVITDADFSGTYFGALFRSSAGVYSAVKYALSASAPTVNDDDTQGYVAGSVWFDTTTKVIFDCVDNSTGAAVWKPRFGKAKIQSVTTSSATIDADADIVEVSYDAGVCTLTLRDASDHPVGKTIEIVKTATSGGFKISVTPDSGSSIQGNSADTTIDLPDSTTDASTTTGDPAWQLRRNGSGTWRYA